MPEILPPMSVGPPAREPFPRGLPEDALRHGVLGHMEDVAVGLVLCQRRALYAGPAMARYIVHWDKDGKPAARILWARLAEDLRRDVSAVPTDHDERRMLAVACSIGGGAPVSLNDALNTHNYVTQLILSHALRRALGGPGESL